MEMGRLAPGEPAIPRRDRPAPCPLSFAQQRLWFLEQLEPDGCVYNIPAAGRLVGPLDVGALREALAAIVARTEALRTTFVGGGEVAGRGGAEGGGGEWRLDG